MMKKVLRFCKILVLVIIVVGIIFDGVLIHKYFNNKTCNDKLPVDVQIDEEEKVELPVKKKSKFDNGR